MSEIPQLIKFANLMCSRLCHDLISPVGAVNSAVELMEDEVENVDREVLTLMSRSAAESTAKLAFFRAAFGDGGSSKSRVTCEHLNALAQAVLPAGKVTLQWDLNDTDQISNSAGKLLLMFVMIAVDALPRGGGINVKVHTLEDGLGVACVAEGPGANLKDNVALTLTGSVNFVDVTARDVTAYYAYALATSLDATVETSSDEGAIMLAALLP